MLKKGANVYKLGSKKGAQFTGGPPLPRKSAPCQKRCTMLINLVAKKEVHNVYESDGGQSIRCQLLVHPSLSEGPSSP